MNATTSLSSKTYHNDWQRPSVDAFVEQMPPGILAIFTTFVPQPDRDNLERHWNFTAAMKLEATRNFICSEKDGVTLEQLKACGPNYKSREVRKLDFSNQALSDEELID